MISDVAEHDTVSWHWSVSSVKWRICWAFIVAPTIYIVTWRCFSSVSFAVVASVECLSIYWCLGPFFAHDVRFRQALPPRTFRACDKRGRGSRFRVHSARVFGVFVSNQFSRRSQGFDIKRLSRKTWELRRSETTRGSAQTCPAHNSSRERTRSFFWGRLVFDGRQMPRIFHNFTCDAWARLKSCGAWVCMTHVGTTA